MLGDTKYMPVLKRGGAIMIIEWILRVCSTDTACWILLTDSISFGQRAIGARDPRLCWFSINNLNH